MLYAETYELAEHISQACGFVTNFGNACPIHDSGVIFFNTEPSCDEDGINMLTNAGKPVPNATLEDLIAMKPTCYNSLNDYNALFTSA